MSVVESVAQLQFVDLYVGESYCDIKGLEGESASLVPAPSILKEHIDEIRQRCKATFHEEEEPEFSLVVDNVMFRVTALRDVLNDDVFILRRSSAQIRPLRTIGLNPFLTEFVLDKDTRGTILCLGEMAAGKSSTIASMLVERLSQQGGIAVAVEDPPETNLNGTHGKGRCIQVRASRKNGGYREQMIRAMRSGADMMLIGEIRDEETAFQVAQAGINGHMILSTMHAGNIIQGIERFATYCRAKTTNANDLLADGLAAVFWQDLEKVPRTGGGYNKRLVSRSLILSGNEGSSARSKIRAGKFDNLINEIEEQSRKAAWQPQRQG